MLLSFSSFRRIYRFAWYQPLDPWSLALFRVVYALVLSSEVWQLFRFRALIFAETGLPGWTITLVLLSWGIALALLALGWRTRWAAAVNYVISVGVVWCLPQFKYHLDYVMLGVNFLLLWLPVSQSLSLDARAPAAGREASVQGIWAFLLAWLPLGLVYLDSVVHKLSSHLWLRGLGFWAPSSMPQNAQVDLTWLLNQEPLVKGVGYGIMLFEATFLLLVWVRPLRWLVVCLGMLLHLGIAVAYPIPHFGLVMAALYIPLLPAGFWQGLRKKVGAPGLAEIAGNCPLRLNKRLLLAFLLYTLVGQLMCLLASPWVQEKAGKAGLRPALAQGLWLYKPFFYLNQKLLGVVPHDIFLDKHFQQYDRLVGLQYVPEAGPPTWLPLLDESGRPGGYCRGRVWTKWVYRVNGPEADSARTARGIGLFAGYWLQEQGLNPARGQIRVWVKRVEAPDKWVPDFLRQQQQRPWKLLKTVPLTQDRGTGGAPVRSAP